MQTAVPYTRRYEQRPEAVVRKATGTRLAGHVATLCMIGFIVSVLFAVVWESAAMRTLAVQKAGLEQDIEALDEAQRVIRAGIARSQMPEEVVVMAMQDDVRFMAIDPKTAYIAKGAD